MKVSIIIPVYNDLHIKDCLASIQNLDFAKQNFEVIVVDNHPEPKLRSWIETQDFASLRYVHESRPGSYVARNAGLKIAQGEILAFTDSDCIVDKNWLNKIVQALQSADAVMGYTAGNNMNRVAKYEQQMYDANIARFTGETNLKRIDTRNFAMKREVYEKLGGFTAELKYGGDMEYGARLHQAGFIIHYAPAMLATHTNPTDLRALLAKRVRQNAGNMLITKIHDREFIQKYFPHLLKYQPPSPLKGESRVSKSPLGHSAVSSAERDLGAEFLYKIWSMLTFPLSNFICTILPKSLGYKFFKLQNVIAIRLGQLAGPHPPAPSPQRRRGALSERSESKGGVEVLVSIIVLSWNSKQITQDCIESILQNVHLDYELILIENDSHDGSADMIRERYHEHPNIVSVLNETNLGYAGGNNQGYALAKGDYIWLLNSDTIIPSNTATNMVEFLDKHPDYGAVTTKLLNPDGSTQYFMHRRFPTLPTIAMALLYKRWRWFCPQRVKQYLYLDKDFTQDFDIEQAAGTSIMLRRSVIEEQGKLFDAAHFPLYYNDVDLCRRLQRAHWKIRCLTSVSITHHKGVSVRKLSLSTTLKRYIPAVYWYWRLDR